MMIDTDATNATERATHYVLLHLANDQNLYLTARDIAANAYHLWQPPDSLVDYFTDPVAGPSRQATARRGAASQALREWVEDITYRDADHTEPHLLLANDLLTWALAIVDWYQVADWALDDE